MAAKSKTQARRERRARVATGIVLPKRAPVLREAHFSHQTSSCLVSSTPRELLDHYSHRPDGDRTIASYCVGDVRFEAADVGHGT